MGQKEMQNKNVVFCTYSCSFSYHLFITSGLWPRVRARVLRTPVILDSLTRKTGRCAPPLRPHSFADPSGEIIDI